MYRSPPEAAQSHHHVRAIGAVCTICDTVHAVHAAVCGLQAIHVHHAARRRLNGVHLDALSRLVAIRVVAAIAGLAAEHEPKDRRVDPASEADGAED